MAEKIKYRWFINTGYPQAKHEGEWEFDKPPTNEELDDMLQIEVANHIDCGWHQIDS